jgi:NAD+ kinase
MRAADKVGRVAPLRSVGLVLHPKRDSAPSIEAVLVWARTHDVTVLALADEVARIDCEATVVPPAELAARADLVISIGGDGTMLRAMRMVSGHRPPVLAVNLGKLGFLADVDVPELPGALARIHAGEYRSEPRAAVCATVPRWTGPGGTTPDPRLSETLDTSSPDGPRVLAFNDIALVRNPGQGLAAVALSVDGQPFLSYSADAVIVATATGSTAYSFSAGGPIVSPTVAGLVVTPAAPHSTFNRAVLLDADELLALEVLPSSGPLSVEVDGEVAGLADPGTVVHLRSVPDAARVVRLGDTTFYQRARRKLNLTGGA